MQFLYSTTAATAVEDYQAYAVKGIRGRRLGRQEGDLEYFLREEWIFLWSPVGEKGLRPTNPDSEKNIFSLSPFFSIFTKFSAAISSPQKIAFISPRLSHFTFP